MREEIQQLIAKDRTEEALALLAQHNSDALLLQARYNQAKKQQNMGMIDFGEWSRVQSQVNYAALVVASKTTIINVQQNTSVNITINFNTIADFKESLNQLDLPTLINVVTQEFKGKPAMEK